MNELNDICKDLLNLEENVYTIREMYLFVILGTYSITILNLLYNYYVKSNDMKYNLDNDNEEETVKQHYFNHNNYGSYVMPELIKSEPLNNKELLRYRFNIDKDMKLGIPVGNYLMLKVVAPHLKDSQIQTTAFDQCRLWKVYPVYNPSNNYFDVVLEKEMLKLLDRNFVNVEPTLYFKGPRGHLRYTSGLQFCINMDNVEYQNILFISNGRGLAPVYNMLQNLSFVRNAGKRNHEVLNEFSIWLFYFENSFDELVYLEELIKLSSEFNLLKPYLLLKEHKESSNGVINLNNVTESFSVEVYEDKAYYKVITEIFERNYIKRIMTQINEEGIPGIGCFISGDDEFSSNILVTMKSLNFNLDNIHLF